jgi:hypothetical protein
MQQRKLKMASEIHYGDIGVNFNITVMNGTAVLNVSNANSISIIFQKPDGSDLIKTATLVTNGTDGNIRYTSVSGDLDQIGTWQIQAKVNFGASVFSTDIQKFKVYRNI